MGRKIEILMYCTKNATDRFKTTFEEKQTEEWYGIHNEKMPPMTFFEKRNLKAKSKNEDSGFSLAKIGSFFGKSKEKSNEKADVRGAFYYDLPCPYCGNNGFVKCGACSEFTCNHYGDTHFKCAVCGNEGEITGTIDSASGDVSRVDSCSLS